VIVPEIETERLLLRALGAEDFEAYADMVADPEVTRYLAAGEPLSRWEAWRQLAMIIGHWELRGFGMWAVEERATGRFLGRIGCFEPDGWPAFEIGYTLARHAWGKGYATEGVAASLHYARAVLQKADVASIIRPDNAASIRVATRLGATLAETVEFFGAPALVYRYP
jgi:RimJ/RimL family protein N-acetyltransferase